MTGGAPAERHVIDYIGRFAPSPTGPLHAGSLVAALASWLDARAHHGRWLVRVEDVDTPRCIPGADAFILQQLATCGLVPDAPPLWQSTRGAAYQQALDQLIEQGDAYPCACSRKDIEEAQAALGHARERHAALPYPGTCRHGLQGRAARSWRFKVHEFKPKQPLTLDGKAQAATNSVANYSTTNGMVRWHDRRLGPQQQDTAAEVGDFVLRRADGLWAYQLAVVVDDAAQGITDVVRGEDLADNTPRQILLQQALGVPVPRYLHTPLVCGDNGEKLSKQNGAQALDLSSPLRALGDAAKSLGLPVPADANTGCISDALHTWVSAWRRNYNGAP
ncbi:tRNA glutamyl-Q(34) synthetase GluQRS [Acidovorax sp. sic0104]|uniref:tRNA glutamyl-Q(34) synthetase GluQRS n=1 Tax=Acidovorax sp. sic0104 TaxID=2854784 RepID=UPI001C439828|nr:tRNA glutamyl-Q(34) synthetase GluQRS [Acidovorax sp. sic0104]MBV7543880.1 tRNA glutamyl-Q(34) synthetase GluQRS [Acidovorax sp. sic0104]